jgi:hypothetical protein
MSDLVTSSVRVSRDEALADYLYDNNTVTYDVVAFDPQRYRRAMRLTDADIKRFLETHGAEVQARYKADERTYKGIKPQLALREIFIPKAIPEPAKAAEPDDKAAKTDDKAKAAKPDDKAAKTDNKAAKTDNKTAKPDDKAAKTDNKVAKVDDKAKTAKPDDKAKTAKADDKKPAAGDAPKPFGLPIDVAKAKLEAVRAQIAAGKLTFPDAEKQLAADSSEDAPAENGDRGWMSVDSLSLGEKAISDAAKTLKPGEMTAVVVSDRGAYLVIATDKREGDLTFDQVKNELAKELAKDVWSKEAAKRGALEIIAKVQAGALNSLEPTFEREPVKPPAGNELQDILNDPSLTDEQKQMILQQYMKRMQQQQKHGSLEVHEKDVPVAWFAEADGSGQTGSAAQAPASGSAAAPAGAATTGSAATGSAAVGAGSGTAPPAPPAPPARPAEIVASNDVLPQFGEVPRPKVNRLGPSPRQAKMPGIGASKEAADALFDELAKNDVAKKIYEGEAGYLLIQLIDRSQPKVEDFDKTADVEIARMQEARGKAALRDWVKSRCETLAKAGRIRPSPDRIRETDDKGNPAPTVYHPCMYFDYLDR